MNIQYGIFSIFFYIYGEKQISKVIKKYVLNYSILYVHYVELLKSNTI
jgi:hypothetical protein